MIFRSLRAGPWLASLALAALLAAPAAPAAAQDDPFPWPGACQDGSAALGGTILDETGDAVAGAQVLAAGPAGFGEVESGEDGAYRIAGLCAGEYQVAAYTADAERAAIGFHDADGDGEPDLLALEEGQSLGEVDVVLSETEVSIVIEPGRGGAACEDPRGSIAGVVLDGSGEAVEGAEVSAFGPGGFGASETDGNGRYRIEGLCAGDYDEVSAISFADGRIGFYDADGDRMPDPVRLGADDAALEGIDIVLAEMPGGGAPRPLPDPGRGRGACETPAASIEGRVTDASGAPVAEVEVQTFGRGGFGTARTDEEGRYRIEGLCAGDYDEVSAISFADGRIGFYDADGDGMPDPVSLGADDAALEGIDIVLGESDPRPIEPRDPGSPAPPACEGEGSISGAARLEDGAVASGADVLVVAEDGSGYHQVLTDEDGGYDLEGLCDGTYVVVAVRVEEDGSLLLGAHDEDGDGEPDLVELGPDGRALEGVDLVLTSLALPLSGALGEAIGGAELSPRASSE